MMRNVYTSILLGIALMMATASAAQSQATPKMAYDYMQVQSAHPTDHYPYFLLGNVYADLAPNEHPIRDYNELMVDLYNVRLFYGNCLHYAVEQNLKQDEYLQVPHAGKRPTYGELVVYLTGRMNEAQEAREKVEQLYQAYYRLYDHTEQCRQLYTAFAETYSREKMAHLSIDSVHYHWLDSLSQMSDSVEADVTAYLDALKQYPIPGYEPVFLSRAIRLYRIDGLTKPNLLGNEIPLWDYKGWVRNFLIEQQTTYEDYYAMLLEEFSPNGLDEQRNLLNTINRLDFESFLYSWVLIRQRNRQLQKALADEALQTPAADYLETILPTIYTYYTYRAQVNEHEGLLGKRISDVEMNKYTELLDSLSLSNRNAVRKSVHESVQAADTTYHAICRKVIGTAALKETAYVPFENEFTGEKIDMGMLTSLGIKEIGVPVAVVQVGYRFLAILANHKVVMFDRDTTYGSPLDFGGASTVLGAYKMTSNAIAILMEDEIVFVDNTGKRK